MLGFVFSRFSFKLNILLLMHVHGGQPPPAQVIIVAALPDLYWLPLPAPLSDNGVCSTTSTSGSS